MLVKFGRNDSKKVIWPKRAANPPILKITANFDTVFLVCSKALTYRENIKYCLGW